jgi:hypothetical protein
LLKNRCKKETGYSESSSTLREATKNHDANLFNLFWFAKCANPVDHSRIKENQKSVVQS